MTSTVRDASPSTRLERYRRVSSALAALDDRQLGALVDAAPSLGAGIGGATALMHVAGARVFVKRLPLTDLERRPENVGSTANLFELPMGCHYGVGSPSFGAWRELAANCMASSWVLDGRTQSFPLLVHRRVLEGHASAEPLPRELADVERTVALWRGSPAVLSRLDAIARSSATLTLFLEHLPHTLPDWLAREVAGGGGDGADAAIALVERNLLTDVASMNSYGLLHFDAHLGNILTDGERLYFTDFGLATSPSFELSASESAFLARNLGHDPCHTITRFVDWLVTELTHAPDWQARNETIRRVAGGDALVGVLPSAKAVIERYAPIAVVINEFYRRLHLVDRDTPYPIEEALRACDACGVEIPRVGQH